MCLCAYNRKSKERSSNDSSVDEGDIYTKTAILLNSMLNSRARVLFQGTYWSCADLFGEYDMSKSHRSHHITQAASHLRIDYMEATVTHFGDDIPFLIDLFPLYSTMASVQRDGGSEVDVIVGSTIHAQHRHTE